MTPSVRTIVLVLAGALLFLAGCSGGVEGPLTPTTPPGSTGTPRPSLPTSLCANTRNPVPQWNVQVTAKWKGDHIVIEGSADLPGPGTVNYWVCQDGQATDSLQRSQNPEYEDGKIKAESKVVEGRVGPVFDPNAHFDVMFSILGQPVQMAYFTIRVPVEGKPG
jgi:hypothetical protein